MATFRQRKGRWQAIIRRADLKATKTFDRLQDARLWATAREREADLAETVPGKMAGTLGELIGRYEKEMWREKRWGPTKAHELVVLRRDLGNRALDAISQTGLLTYARGLGLSGGSISTRFSYLKEVLKTARDLWGLTVPLAAVEGAISTGRRLGIVTKSGVRDRRPTEEEVTAIMAYARSRPAMMIDLAAVVQVLTVQPLRLGELLGIQWDDLNETRRTALIRNRKHPDVKVREGNDQEVPLINFGGVAVYDLIARRPRYLPSPFPYIGSSVSAAFTLAALRCRIEDLHLHDLRAYAISKLLEGGIPIPQVALMSGHRNWKVLQRVYTRLDPVTVHATILRASSSPGTPAPTPPGKAVPASSSRKRGGRSRGS